MAKYYHFEKLLGHGASGKVYLVYHRESGEKFACKVIKKDGSMNDAQSMSTEIEIMKRCRHLNIVSLYELFESSGICYSFLLSISSVSLLYHSILIRYLFHSHPLLHFHCIHYQPVCMWLILELVEGTGLRGGVSGHAHYTEQVCSRFVKQMCMGLHYLHNMGVIHRDIKIDNILLSVRGDGSQHDHTYVKITDFGLSAFLKPGDRGYQETSQKRKEFVSLTDMWGTPTHYGRYCDTLV